MTRGRRRVVRITREPANPTAAADRLAAVLERMKALNPGYNGWVETIRERGEVIGLKFAPGAVTDLSPLRDLPSLRRLECQGGPGGGAGPRLASLKGLRLVSLDCFQSPVDDLTPLAGMPLMHLEAGRTRVADLAPLRGLPLEFLSVYGTRVTDLAPLKGMPLFELNISRLDVSDLGPLADTRIARLWCDHTKVSDLRPVGRLPLERITLDFTRVTDLSPLSRSTLHLIRIGPTTDPGPCGRSRA